MSRGPLHVNARIISVVDATAATGGRDDWWADVESEEPAGAGASKWTGDEPAYYREAIDDSTGDVLERRTLWLATQTARTIGIDTDDVILFIGPDGQQHTATAQAVAYSDASSRYIAGEELGPSIVGPRLETTRLELTPA